MHSIAQYIWYLGQQDIDLPLGHRLDLQRRGCNAGPIIQRGGSDSASDERMMQE